MGKGYICDMFESAFPGESVKSMLVNLSSRLALLIVPQERLGPGRNGQGDLSPDAARKIEEALAVLKTKDLLEAEAKEKAKPAAKK